jgi:isoleucyl-tRNA synthetase
MFSGKKLLKEKINSSHVLDQWLQAKTDLLVKEVGDNLDKYNIFSASRLLGVYIDELSTWYVRRSRDRFKGEDVNDKNQAINTLGWALSTLIKVMAPFTPFIAEHIYQTLGAEKESVHLEDWPTIINDIEKDSQDGRVIYNMAIVRKIVELALAERNKAGIKIRQPLSKLSVSGFDLGGYEETFQSIVADEVNVKAVEFVNSEKDDLSVYLDTTIDDSLQKQGIARELARQFNALRKAAKLTVADKVDLVCSTSDQLIKAAIEENKSQLLSQTGSRDLKSDEFTEALFQSECLIGDIKVVLAIVKK